MAQSPPASDREQLYTSPVEAPSASPALRELSLFSGTKSEEIIKAKVMELAAQNQIPLDPDFIEITHKVVPGIGDHSVIKVAYAVNVPVVSYTRKPDEITAFYKEAIRRISALPGVEQVALGTVVPWRDQGFFAAQYTSPTITKFWRASSNTLGKRPMARLLCAPN